MNILIIDDEGTEGFSGSLKKYLDALGHSVTVKNDPQTGIDTMNHKFDIVFIDFLFSKNPEVKTGSQVGLEIRKKCPLAAMVLITAFGNNHIRDFIYVGFDDYYDKNNDGNTDSERNQRKQDCIKTALENSQNRIKSKFTENELSRVKLRLDALQHAYITHKTNRTHQAIATAVFRYELNEGIVFKAKDKDGKPKILSGSSIQDYFKLFDKERNFVINENVLKAKQLLVQNKDKWPDVRTNFRPIKELIEEFGL